MSRPNKTPRVKDPASPHQCPQCDRTYERPDHLARHLDSHRDERTFQCTICHRGFNRRDVLQRHLLVHANGTSISKQHGRAMEACGQCAAAKASCDNSIPCKRCQRKDVSCVPRKPNGRREKAIATPAEGPVSGDIESPPMSSNLSTDQGHKRKRTYSASASSTVSFPTRTPGARPSHDFLESCSAANGFPAFFGNIMMPPDLSHNSLMEVQQPRSVFDLMRDPEYDTLSADAALFGVDILADLDRILEFNPSPVEITPSLDLSAPTETQSTKQRVAAFRRSLWLWIPEKNQNGFSEEGQIPLQDADMTSSISSLHRSRLESLNIRGKLTSQMRDHIFQLVLATGGSRLTVPSFPTAESLDALIKIGISKRTETDAWIHPYTLYRQDSRPELLTALVAAGCVCSAIPSIGKAGVILLEIVRLSLAQLVESDNSVLRDLQYFQASMVWLDIGIFCGYKRKMQIAESYLQPLCTALRRAGAFDRSFYTPIQPLDGAAKDEELDSIWLQWVQQESLIRLVYHLFEHDVEVAAAMNRPALISYTELTLPFPCARELWLAPTAAVWKCLRQTKYLQTMPSDLSLRELLADQSILNNLPVDVDRGVANSASLHGLMSQVSGFRQQASLLDDSRHDTCAVAKLWLQSRQDDLLSSIKAATEDMVNLPANATLFSEFGMMHLHLNFDSIQRFAGQFGEVEARREYPNLRRWSLTKEARTSIWHAGQVLRAARQVLPFQLRGFDNLAIYHATLILWVFGLLLCGEERNEHRNSESDGRLNPVIALDDDASEPKKAFIHQGIGRPSLTLHSIDADGEIRSNFSSLTSPRLVMDVGRQVLNSNFPGATDNLPPLVENLRNLMCELGSLQ
ncbi:C2H2-type zinc finger protein [Aspergillus undulatus]|uniref:C2H2-type zinc finger protein n=1 Tax=Aspergillus undulatus TaxID=1810928 RepID=UPI003CCD4D9B